ncbi:MAG: amidohydrolase family protein, partial [Acidimicrobiia bacterium]
MVIRGGRVIDPSGDRVADVLVRGGRVVEVGPDAATGAENAEVLDADGCIVTPGLVDLHVHLREPGMEEAETIETGTNAAALGGFSAVVAMPNTTPALDDPAIVSSILAAGQRAACEVVSSGCITEGREGEALAPMGELHSLGVRIFTDDGACVADASVMRHALEYSLALPGAVIAQHAEDPALAGTGAMHEGEWSSRLGIPGRPSAAEDVMGARDVILAELT